MTKRERFAHLQGLLRALLDELSPPKATPLPEPPQAPAPERPHAPRIMTGGRMCCPLHEELWSRRETTAGLIRLEHILDLQNHLRR